MGRKIKYFLKQRLKLYANKLGKDYDTILEEYKKEKILVNCLGFCSEYIEPLVFKNYEVASKVLDIDEIIILGTALGLNEVTKYHYKALSICIAKGKIFTDNFPNINLSNYTFKKNKQNEKAVENMKKANISYTVWYATKDEDKTVDLTTYKDFYTLNSEELKKKYSIYFE
ncbi:MAG: hypothetical protein MR691_15735 [Clostridium sp.]|nr:hypothetical protein [Clostridium sp.]